jgi:hypothetical protein
MNEILIALGSGLVTGLVTWGGMRVEIRYLRRDVDRAHWRLDQLPCGGHYRRETDLQGGCHGQA